MNWRPGSALAWAAGGWLLLALAVVAWPGLLGAWWMAGLVLAVAGGFDAWRLWRLPLPAARRRVDRNLPVGAWSPVRLALRNRATRSLDLRLHDGHPEAFVAEGMPLAVAMVAGAEVEVRYRVRPPRRGPAAFEAVALELDSPWRLWRRRARSGTAQAVRVLPDFSAVARYALLADRRAMGRIGPHPLRRRGEGTELHQLRDYRAGDSLRQIDWKASARLRRPIAREYQDERDQRLLFLLDCGSRMRHRDGDRAHLDEALAAVLLLAHVALRDGDAVGLLTFGGERRWLAPRKGVGVVAALLEATYDLEAVTEAADFRAAAGELMARQRRRALVVLVTDTRAEDAEDLEAATRLLAVRHRVLVADLRETVLDDIAARPVRGLDDALRYQAADAYRAQRHAGHARIRHHGVRLLDLRPAQLPSALVAQYLALKGEASL